MRRFSITDKLIIASLALSIITIIIVASYSFTNAKEAILDRTFNQLTSVRVIKANLLDKFLSNCVKEVQMARTSADIREITEQLNKLEKPSTSHFDKSILADHHTFIREIQENFYHRIFIIGKNRNICQLKTDDSKKETSIDAKEIEIQLGENHEVLITDFEKLEQGTNVIRVLAPIISQTDETLGIMLFEISSNSIDSIMLEYNPSHGLGISGESYLVGEDLLMRSSSRFHPNSILKTKVATKAVNLALNGEEGAELIQDYRGIKVLSSFGRLDTPQLNWVIISEIDYKEATIPIYRIRNEIIFISIFIFFLVLVVIYILSRRITIPIQKLNEAAKEIGSGNLNIDLQTNLNDEIGELTNTFNQMALELKAEREKSLGSLIDGQESERQRLSRELHDSLGQSLIGLKLKYESCLNQSETSNSKKENFLQLASLFDRTIEETRRISNNLMPAALKEFGLFSAMRHLCNEIADTSNIQINFKTIGKDQTLDPKLKTYVFRITQEAITNILKHSKASHASIHIEVSIHILNLDIKDDGIGFNETVDIKNSSNGINNIKDRIRLLSGLVILNSEPQIGTHIHIEIPLKPENDE